MSMFVALLLLILIERSQGVLLPKITASHSRVQGTTTGRTADASLARCALSIEFSR
jgi:hypothetical protein